MGAYYDEIEIEDMAWDEVKGVYHYPCPCGDRFEISRRQLADCEDIATCPSCSLIIRVVYDPVRLERVPLSYMYSDCGYIYFGSLILKMSLQMTRTRRNLRRVSQRATTITSRMH
jgi:diphthamide biosynthesis protein 3